MIALLAYVVASARGTYEDTGGGRHRREEPRPHRRWKGGKKKRR